ncbi:type I-F CRISPR-associated endoribonuclease Cas6/Csy4 [Legionella septentrionalis]|uniref:type I-F CRISPR-associated endoribonuclease Cas6/Csy4 n=1 Tax=Legionella septentrionalis TaxID=2498109 RepID=UPI000F8E2D57|nr:type I-F CRISPR-associated endoribonuclease Cas6/Csy4 [Legionella septentrionalis]RUQ97049.1 type I-F CRISPR-associated endoribonuclease Cas6/Csy4 [Legionella septentrionalis]
MNHYLDITLQPDPEFSESILMNALFNKLHRHLVKLNSHSIGVSFPHVTNVLGDCLRLHGESIALENLMQAHWMKGMKDYTVISMVRPVPSNVQYRTVSRVHQKKSAEQLRRRSVKKGWLTEQEAQLTIHQREPFKINLPFLLLTSQSTGQNFKLFIHHSDFKEVAVIGKFNQYGLSAHATIPWF